MKIETIKSTRRKAVNLSLDTSVVEAARAVGLNLSQVCEAALLKASKQEEERRFREENKMAFDYWNKWVEEHGLPLEKYRQF